MTRRKELFRYIIFGVATTLVALAVYQGFEWLLIPLWGSRSYLFSNVVSFIAALVFAYVVNKLFVFEQKSWAPRIVAREITTFTFSRVFSLAVEYALLLVFNEWLWQRVAPRFTLRWLNSPFAQHVSAEFAYRFLTRWGLIAVAVVVLNYVFAKWVVFKKEEQDETDIVEC